MERGISSDLGNRDLEALELDEVQGIELAGLESLKDDYCNDADDESMENETRKRKQRNQKERVIRLKRNADGSRAYPFAGQKRKMKQNTQEEKQSDASDTECCMMDTHDNPSEEIGELRDLNLTSLVNHDLLKKHPKKKTWSERKKDEEEHWKDEREAIFLAVVDSYSNEGFCHCCHENPISIKCFDCFEKDLCTACDEKRHKFETLHNRIGYVDGFRRSMIPSETLDDNLAINEKSSMVPLLPKVCSSCKGKEVTRIPGDHINFVSFTGKYSLRLFTTRCLECGAFDNPFTIPNIVQSGFWPNSPKKLSYLFDQKLFRFWDGLRKNAPGTSENSFLEVLNTLAKFHGRPGKITPSIFSTAFKEWCFCQYRIDCAQNKNWLECPACAFEQHSSHVDGNCKLYHYKNAGTRTRSEFYDGLFIVNGVTVKPFIQELYQGKFGKVKNEVRCGGVWSAARNTARNKKSLDITGLEVMSCRHQLGQKALNMHQGELYGYALFLIKHHMIPRKVQFVYADVMCKLRKFVERIDPETATKFTGALSVMHAKGHALDCQVLWDGEWIDGTGRSTGEETEQIFSFLSRFCNTTKYQKPENREETLTEMILFWNKRKIEAQAEYLVKKYKKVQADLTQHQTDVRTALEKFDIRLNFTELKNEIQAIACKVTVPSTASLTDSAKIMLLFHSLKGQANTEEFSFLASICPNLPDVSVLNIPLLQKKKDVKIKMLRDLIKSYGPHDPNDVLSLVTVGYQRMMENIYFEKVHWLTRIKKIADTSKQRFVLRKKASKATTAMQNLVTLYNEFARDKVVYDDVIKGSFKWVIDLQQSRYPRGFTDIEKRCVLISQLKKQRCEEELLILQLEMRKYLRFYGNKCLAMEQEIRDLESSEHLGKLFLVREGYLYAQHMLRQALSLFRGIIPDVENVENGTSESENENEDEIFQKVDDDDDDAYDANDANDADDDDIRVDVDGDDTDEIGLELVLSTGNDLMNGCTVSMVENVVKFPSELSQARMSGRNGSSACTTIALLVGHFMPPLFLDWSSLDVSACFVGCIEIGNSLHNNRASTNVDESLSILSGLNVVITSYSNTLFGNLYDSMENFVGYVVLTGKGQSFCAIPCPDFIVIFDSHLHGEFGATITKICSQEDLNAMLNFSYDEVVDMCLISDE